MTDALANGNFDYCYINLIGTDVNKIQLAYKSFRLWFPEKDSVDYELKANIYSALLKKQKEMGFMKSYEILDKEFREFQYTNAGYRYGLVWGRFVNWVEKNWWGYGYNKEYIIRNVIFIYLLFSFINVFILDHLTYKVYKSEKINEWKKSINEKPILLFLASMPFSMFYTAQIFLDLELMLRNFYMLKIFKNGRYLI